RPASSSRTGPRPSSTSSTKRSAASSLSCMSESLGEHTFARHLAAVRAEPSEGAEQVTQVFPGEPLTVERRVGGWARIRTAYDYPGWIQSSELGGDRDPNWLASIA